MSAQEVEADEEEEDEGEDEGDAEGAEEEEEVSDNDKEVEPAAALEEEEEDEDVEEVSGKLEVYIGRGDGFPKSDAQIFCKCSVARDEEDEDDEDAPEFQTKAVKSRAPIWEETHDLDPWSFDQALEFTLHEAAKPDDDIGTATLAAEDLKNGRYEGDVEFDDPQRTIHVVAVYKPGRPPSICKGELTIRSETRGNLMRFFVLTRAGLYYYADEQEYESGASEKGHVAVDKVETLIVSAREDWVGLKIRHKNHGRDLELLMDSQSELKVWEKALRKMLGADRVVLEQDDFRARVQEQMRVVKLGGKGMSSELQTFLPWRRAKAAPAIKNALRAAVQEPYIGPPVPAGYKFADKELATRMDMASSSDMKFAFNMLDTSGSKILQRDAARNWFRCLGWCCIDEDLDFALDEVFLGATSRKSGKRRGAGLVQGPWGLEQLKEAQSILARTRGNGSVESLKEALTLLADENGTHASFENMQAQNFAEKKPPVNDEDFPVVMDAIHLFEGSKPVNLQTVAMRVVSRIVSPESILDLPPKEENYRAKKGLDDSLRSSLNEDE